MLNLNLRIMRKSQIWSLAMLTLFTIGIVFSGCKEDDPPPCTTGDKTELTQAIADAQALHDGAVEGTEPGEYLAGSKEALQASIDLATEVLNTNCVTQAQLDAAVVSLNAAVAVFEEQKITGVEPGALVAHWLFNGDGTDASGNGHDGVASAGHTEWGGGMPELATDRHGNADYCYKFVDGGNFVVANASVFVPAEMTISVWMKLYDTWAHSYFFSNDIWNCYKFQVQDANKPFFTAKITKDDGTGDPAWIDKDSNTGILDLEKWYQVVLTYKSGAMTFYIDGVKVQFWDDFPTGTLFPPNPAVDICIGQALPTDVYTDIPDDPYEWKEWLGYFKGYMDDMRFYNVILTDAQIVTQYNYEKDNTVTQK